MDVKSLTVRALTPPGYFNQAEDAPVDHAAYIMWWNAFLSSRAIDAVTLKTLLLTPWLVDHPDSPRTPWLQYLTTQYGFGFFGGTNNQAAALYRLLSSAWNTGTIYNINLVIQTLSLPPFSWFSSGIISVGNLLSSLTDTGFIIYSTASSPSPPAPTAYSARAWTVPSGWTQAASSAVKYSRGYISGGTLVWCTPRPVSDFSNVYVFSAAVPLAVAAAGTVAIVDDDSSGDRSVSYYSDGSAWRKNSTPNADLGLVTGDARPDPEAVTVWAPNPATVVYSINSQTPPPDSGRSAGHGTFSSWSETSIFNDAVVIDISQISGGNTALSTMIALLRRIKPTGKIFALYISGTKYNISDARQKT